MDAMRIDLGLAAPVRLGRLTLNPALREIRRDDGAEEIVEPRVMQVLLALAESRGAIVRREDLNDRCWEGRVVGDDAMNRVLSRLRRVASGIGDSSFRIETITKIGYRLVELEAAALRDPDSPPTAAHTVGARRTEPRLRRVPAAGILIAGLVVAALASAWWLLTPTPAPDSMTIRLAGFQTLSSDLPPGISKAVDAEITAGFNAEGVVGVRSGSAPVAGSAPAYALGGTIYREGDAIRVVTKLMNERTGAVLWSDSAEYASGQAPSMPRKVAVEVGIVVRCGLFGASTYSKPLSDQVMSNYLQYCQEYWSYGGSKTLHFAQRVVAANPDFSWGWSAVGNGYMQAANAEPDVLHAAALREAGRRAEDRAITLDPRNSEALGHKTYLIEPRDWLGKEQLFRRAIAAKPLDCGCEHYGYGLTLQSVGRIGDAVKQFRSATDILALWPDSQFALAEALLTTGRESEANTHFRAASELSKDPNLDVWLAVTEGVETGDYPAAISALRGDRFQYPREPRSELLAGYEALNSADPALRAGAVQRLKALPMTKHTETSARLLAALGANAEALAIASEKPWLFWRRSMRGVLSDPGFPAVVEKLGLTAYWKSTRTKPDVCSSEGSPAFCSDIVAGRGG